MHAVTLAVTIQNLNELDQSLRQALPEFTGLTYSDSTGLQVWFTTDNINLSLLNQTVTAQITKEYFRQVVSDAIVFGQQIIKEVATENVMLGITQAGMTTTVRHITSDVTNALSTGSLYDAIIAIRAIPESSYDSTFITPTRLLACINRIERYLGIPLSEAL